MPHKHKIAIAGNHDMSSDPSKTSYINGFYRKQFQHIYFIMPKNSLNNLPDSHAYKKHIEAEPDTYSNTLDPEKLQIILKQCAADAGEGEKSLIVIDDMLASLKNPDVIRLLSELASNRRHCC